MSNNNQEESDVSVEPDSDSDSEENRVVNEDEDREEDDEEEWEDINEGDEAEDDGEGNAVDGAEIVSNLVIDMTKMAVDESKLQEFCNDIFSEDSKSQFRGTQEIRKILFVEGVIPPIQEVIETGIVPQLVNFLLRDEFPELQFEAAWALTNIASGTVEQTRVIIDAGAIINLVPLIHSKDPNVQEQAMWTLSNISGDSTEFRDLVLSSDIVPTLVDYAANNWTEGIKESILQNIAFLISNLCRRKPTPPLSIIGPLLPLAKRLYLNHSSNNSEILLDSTWSFAYVSDGGMAHLEAIVNQELIPHFILQLSDVHRTNSEKIITPALRVLGNLIQSDDDTHTQAVLNYSPLPAFGMLLQAPTSTVNIRKEILWILSNIAAGSQDQIQSIIDANILPAVYNLLQQYDLPIALITEGIWIYANIEKGGSVEQVKHVWNEPTLQVLIELFNLNLRPSVVFTVSTLDPLFESIVDLLNYYHKRLNEHRQDLIDYIQLLKKLNGETILRNCKMKLRKDLLDQFYHFLSPTFVI